MTVIILSLLLVWIGIGALWRALGLAVRLVVMLALASAICSMLGTGGMPLVRPRPDRRRRGPSPII
jgi:hypothetical protein